MKIRICFLVFLMGMCFWSKDAIAGGSLLGTGTCPVPGITGVSQSITFGLQGPTPPPEAKITIVSGACEVIGDFPDNTWLVIEGVNQISWIHGPGWFQSYDFVGLPVATSIFSLTMSYDGDFGIPTGASPGTCEINVSWRDPSPSPTEVSGSVQMEVGQTVELDGTVEYASDYAWATVGDCSIAGATNLPTVTIKGDRFGGCLITRAACNSYNECTTDLHDMKIVGPTWMIMIRYLLGF